MEKYTDDVFFLSFQKNFVTVSLLVENSFPHRHHSTVVFIWFALFGKYATVLIDHCPLVVYSKGRLNQS